MTRNFAEAVSVRGTLTIVGGGYDDFAVQFQVDDEDYPRLTIDMNGVAVGDGTAAATAVLRVANSAAGSTPGTCQAKIEVFDETGVSLGFLAVYDAIT